MRRNQRGRGEDRGVIGLEALQRVSLDRAGEKLGFERIKLFRDIVLAMEIALVENLGENVFRQNMLDQHLAHVGGGDGGVDRLLRVLQKFNLSRAEIRLFGFGLVDHVAQGLENLRQIHLELRDRLAEIGDLRPLIAEE